MMEELWATTPAQTPQSAITAAAPSPSAESNGALKRANDTVATGEASKKGRRNRSPYWAYFEKILVNGLQKAVCKHCSRQIGCDPRYGTSVLKNHIDRCKGNPPKLDKLDPDEGFEPYSPLPPPPTPPTPTLALNPVPWDKFPAAVSVHQMMETMERLRQDPFAYGSSTWSSGAEGNGGYRTGRTPWAIRESEASYNMRFDMPGMTRSDVKVWVEDSVMVVEAEKVGFTEEMDDDEWPVESYGKYNSRILLPESVNAENVMAKVKDGVLYISVPKARATGKRVVVDVQ